MPVHAQSEKRERFRLAYQKLSELRAAEPAGDFEAQQRAAANHVTSTLGISRPLADRYVAEAARILNAGAAPGANPESLFEAGAFARVSDLDDKFGATFMVLAHHVEQILKGGKHMSRRFRKWGDEGDTFRVKGKAFRFVRITRLRVGDITDDDIRKEGYQSKEEFEQMWIKSHPRTVSAGKILKPDDLCWCHEYEPA